MRRDDIDICEGIKQEWRQTMGAATIVDLQSAYLQLHVVENLWQYQLIMYKGATYCLTRLGFGLNVTPKIMAAVFKTVLK